MEIERFYNIQTKDALWFVERVVCRIGFAAITSHDHFINLFNQTKKFFKKSLAVFQYITIYFLR